MKKYLVKITWHTFSIVTSGNKSNADEIWTVQSWNVKNGLDKNSQQSTN